MKLLFVSDLHAQEVKMSWVLEHARAFDAVCVAGDLLDIFSAEPPERQQRRVLSWRDSVLREGTALVWCSGNHDFILGDRTPVEGHSPAWMCDTTMAGFIGDGRSERIKLRSGELVITTIPWPAAYAGMFAEDVQESYDREIHSLISEGQHLSVELPWLLLCHEPPASTKIAGDYLSQEALLARQIVEAARPNISLHGHMHEAPNSPDGGFCDTLAEACCFNTGQASAEAEPHYIVLRLGGSGAWSAQWVAGNRKRASEGKLYRSTERGC